MEIDQSLENRLKWPMRGCNSVGRVSASQAECRGFESRRPLHSFAASQASIELQLLVRCYDQYPTSRRS